MSNMIPQQVNTTSKKVKYCGTEKFVNVATGELEEMTVTSVEERDCNFNKVFMRNFLFTLDNLGNKKIKVATYIMDNADSNNLFVGNMSDIEKATGFGHNTINDTIQILIDSNFMKRIQRGVYLINADIIAKGSRSHRLNMLNRYSQLDVDKEQITKAKKIHNLEKSISKMQAELKKLKKESD